MRVHLKGIDHDQQFEPFAFWCEEVARVKTLIRVIECLKDTHTLTSPPISELLDLSGPLPTFRDTFDEGFAIRIAAFGSFSQFMIGRELTLAPDLRSKAYVLLRHQINQQLAADVTPLIDLVPRSPIYLIPKTLLGAIYLKLAAAYTGGPGEWRPCQAPGCDNLVEDPDIRSMYCSKECMNRAKNKRRAERRRTENHG